MLYYIAHPLNISELYSKLKADQPHPHDYSAHRQTPWTDNDSSLLFAAFGKAPNGSAMSSRVLTDRRTGRQIDRQADPAKSIIFLLR